MKVNFTRAASMAVQASLSIMLGIAAVTVGAQSRDSTTKAQDTKPHAAALSPLTVALPPQAFAAQGGNEFILDFTKTPVSGLPRAAKAAPESVDLSSYDLEITLAGVAGKRVQLWYKDGTWRNVYSYPTTAQDGQPIRFNPRADKRNVDEFKEFFEINAVGAKVLEGIGSTKITSARLLRREK